MSFSDQEICSICLQSLPKQDVKKLIRCGHEFHLDCIKQWKVVGTNERCPICRKPLDLRDTRGTAKHNFMDNMGQRSVQRKCKYSLILAMCWSVIALFLYIGTYQNYPIKEEQCVLI
eukprot:245736_1